MKYELNEMIDNSDERMLESFFAKSRTDIANDGFVERVMAALPERCAVSAVSAASAASAAFVRLRRWSVALNAIAIISIVVAVLMALGTLLTNIDLHSLLVSPYNLLINALLFIHRLPTYIKAPDPRQLVSIAVAAVVLMTLFIQQFASLIRKVEG